MIQRVHMFCSMRNRKGFTLIELLIVVSIIAILAAIAIPQFSAYRRRAYNAAAMSDLRHLRTAEAGMFADFQDYGSGANAVAGAAFTLTGAHTSTMPHTVTVSNGVLGIALTTASSGKNTSYLVKTTHVAGEKVYGGDIDSPSAYTHACTTAGACAAADRDVPPAASTTGTDDFNGLTTWSLM